MMMWLFHLLLGTILAPKEPSPSTSLTFHLRHTHATANTSRIIFRDVLPSLQTTPFRVAAKPVRTHKPTVSGGWDGTDVPSPDVEQRLTLLELAKMTYNAYNEDRNASGGWYDLGSEWDKVSSSCCLPRRV